ncbi:Tetratricopeptide repeat-containing protein [Stigmatella aurantiaca]|uniref:Tetratricopeptide repeat-containing protein n=1 Tax=Stigmatella aurantiaca TaxID=41 RepID=A0A1H7HLF2_STIAU|nr:tetratricopeptide repeat protein [Stigmatella aurantiaca]SEK50958.1 Tetratricopeptide repeat-containing protein [Stigmatella aurantiaca]
MSPYNEDGEEPFELLTPLDDRSGPARRISRQKAADMVRAALDAAATQPSSAPPKPVRRRWPRAAWAGGSLLVTAAAAAGIGHLVSAPPPEPPSSVNAPLPPEPGPPPAESAPPEVPGPVPAEPPPGEPPEAALEAEPPPGPVRKEPRPAKVLAPEDLLRMANAHRVAGRWKEADALYQRVIRAHPGGMAAYVARVASGSLRLEHLGDARGALRQFQAAQRLRPEGMLSHEASHGVAEAWRALGDRAQEAQALEQFLAGHPDSPLEAAARKRLRELTGP